jgi:hypothetical protein
LLKKHSFFRYGYGVLFLLCQKSLSKEEGAVHKKIVIKKRVILSSALFLALNLSAMDTELVGAELQVLVDGGSAQAPAAQDEPTIQGAQRMSDQEELYNFIGSENKRHLKGHDIEHILRVFDQLKLEQHMSVMALKQFDEVQKSGQSGPLTRRKHHAKPRAAQHNLVRQNNNACEQTGEQEEKEQEQELAVLAKGREKAQAELTTVLLSVLSQQLKERADKFEEEKKQAHEKLQEHQEQAAKKDKCAVCLKRTTAMVTILGTLAAAWAAVATAKCAEHAGGK